MSLEIDVWPSDLTEQLAELVRRLRARGVSETEVQRVVADAAGVFAGRATSVTGVVTEALQRATSRLPFIASAAVTRSDGRVDELLVTADGVLCHRREVADGPAIWEVVRSGLGEVRALVASAAGDDHLEAFALLSSGVILRMELRDGAGWSKTKELASPEGTSVTALASWVRPPHQELVIGSSDRRVIYLSRGKSGGWGRSWLPIAKNDNDIAGVTGCGGEHDLEVWVLDVHGTLDHATWTKDSGWSDWRGMEPPLGMHVTSVVAAQHPESPRRELFIAAANGRVAFRTHDDGVWSPWQEAPPTPTALRRISVVPRASRETTIVATLEGGRTVVLTRRKGKTGEWVDLT